MPIRTRARKPRSEKMQSPSKHARRDGRLRRTARHFTPSLAETFRRVDEAVRRGDYEALLEMGARSLQRSTHLVDQMVAEQRKALREMAKLEKRIDRSQAQTARMLRQLLNGSSSA